MGPGGQVFVGPEGPRGVQRSLWSQEVLMGVRSGPGPFEEPPRCCAERLRSRDNERNHSGWSHLEQAFKLKTVWYVLCAAHLRVDPYSHYIV